MLGLGHMLAAVAITALVSGGGAGWFAYEAGRNAELATQAREDRVAEVSRAAAADAAASAIASIRVQNTTIRGEVRREISERVVYRDCVHSPDQLRRLNEAITGRAGPAGGGVVP
jgi:hypothetical protein